MCVDFRDLNKAYPKDDFPLPHIDVLVDNTAKNASMSFMDGFSRHNQIKMAPKYIRKESWSFINTLNQQNQLPWLCLDDFNEIIKREEKLEGTLRPHQQIEVFRNVVDKCGFKDMGYSGPDYTWCNQQEGENKVYLRLDKAFATMDQLDHFQNIKVQHLVDTTSDHCPILLTDAKVLQEQRKHKFHFEAIWTRRANCNELIKEV